MQPSRFLLLLSALGLWLPACVDASEPQAASSNALEADPAVSDYLEGKAFAALTSQVAEAVKAALAAAPGAETRHAMLDLFRTPKWLMLGSANDPTSCVTDGTAAQLQIAQWAKATSLPAAAETAVLADVRASADVASVRAVLVSQDVRRIDATLSAIASRLSHATPAFAAPPTCGGDGGGGGGGGTSCGTTTAACGGSGRTTRAANDPMPGGQDARRVLGEMFAAAEVKAPSRWMLLEWDALRSEYRTTLERSAPAVREALRTARREGSATLTRSSGGRATQKFDQGAILVDQLARGGAAFSADAMNAVHAVVAEKRPGHMRAAGEDVRRGRRDDRVYLPGSEVAAAVEQLFSDVRARARDGVAVPRLAAMFDQRMISVHPYVDANGRTTRLMTDWLLARGGYPPAIASGDALSAALFWQGSEAPKDAHLERITEGMRHAVAIASAVA
jgi:hypothetical protein